MKITGDPLHYAQSIGKPQNGDRRAALVYGPNRALATEVVTVLRRTWLAESGESNDFSAVTLAAEDIKKNPARLGDEMAAFGFFAAKKIIHIRECTDAIAKPAADALTAPDAGHFMILEAEELGPKSSLRAWAEKSPHVASLACYMLDGLALNRFVQDKFRQQNAEISSDALALLLHRLGGDLVGLPNIITQLVDYIGGDKTIIKAEHVDAMLVDQAEHEKDVLVSALASGDLKTMDRIFQSLDESGHSMIGVLRIAQSYFYKLRQVAADIKSGTSTEEAIKKMRPPLFFKAKPSFIRHLRDWPLKRIDRALGEFLHLEALCKKTGTPELALVQQRFMALALK